MNLWHVGMKVFDSIMIVTGAGLAVAGGFFLADDIKSSKEYGTKTEEVETKEEEQ